MRTWLRVLDSPRQLLSPSYPDVLALRRPASASWVLREAKQVAPTTRLAGRQSSKSRCVPPGSHSAPPASSSPLAFHHFEAGVEFVAAPGAAHAPAPAPPPPPRTRQPPP